MRSAIVLVMLVGCATGGLTRRQARRRVGFEVSAAGAAAAVAGIAVGIDAQVTADAARSKGCVTSLARCPAPALGTAADAYARANLATGLVVGGLVVGGLGLGLAFAPGRDAAPVVVVGGKF